MNDFSINNQRLTNHNHGLVSHLICNPFCPMQSTAHKVANVVFHILLFPLGIVRLIYFVGRKLFSLPPQPHPLQQQQLQTITIATQIVSSPAIPISLSTSTQEPEQANAQDGATAPESENEDVIDIPRTEQITIQIKSPQSLIISTLQQSDIFHYVNSFLSPQDTARLLQTTKPLQPDNQRLSTIYNTQLSLMKDSSVDYVLKIVQFCRQAGPHTIIPVFKKITSISFTTIADADLHLLCQICPMINFLGHNRYNKISNVSLSYLRKLPLQTLYLERSEITDAELVHFKGMPLQRLNLSYNEVTNSGLVNLKGIQLQELHLRCTSITNAGLANLKGMPLNYLNLQDTRITDSGLVYLKGMPLNHLNLQNTLITNAGLVHLKGMPLNHLNLQNTLITDSGLVHLKGIPLEYLNLNRNRVTNAGLVHLVGMPFKWLNLRDTEITDDGLAQYENLSPWIVR